MPTMDEMTCVICEQVSKADDIAKYGMCETCYLAFKDTEEAQDLDKQGRFAEDEEATDLTKTVDAYRKRKIYMVNYNQRPDVKEKRKSYMRERNKREALRIKRAKALGLL